MKELTAKMMLHRRNTWQGVLKRTDFKTLELKPDSELFLKLRIFSMELHFCNLNL